MNTLNNLNIMDGADPIFYSGENEEAFLLIHGFSGTPYEMGFIADSLANKGYTVECPLLAGHGTKWENLNKVSYKDWIRDVDNSINILRKMKKKIYLVGASMGGALALNAAKYCKDIEGVILINPVLFFEGYRHNILCLGRFFIKSVAIKDDSESDQINDKSVKMVHYTVLPTNGAFQMQTLMRKIRKNLNNVSTPLLYFKSIQDPMNYREMKFVITKLLHLYPEIVWLENSLHLASLDYDKDYIVENIIAFVEKKKRNAFI